MTTDTTNAAREAHLAVLRRLGPSERVRITVEMSEDALRIATAGERRRHPELDEVSARAAVLDRTRAR